ncbi:unnamed protein product [Durusdinium trenchii]|uniref:Integrase catalytic domain-containing protein n=1 Tax=Durusdinium trenchii TaxID=1381693 RepID=A0ABP0SZE3_9DINO
MNFNEVVGVDLIQLSVPEVGDYVLLNAWVSHYGPPVLVIADQGREFVGSPFTDGLGQQGVPIHFIDARAPWQNGRTEKAGRIFKTRFGTVVEEDARRHVWTRIVVFVWHPRLVLEWKWASGLALGREDWEGTVGVPPRVALCLTKGSGLDTLDAVGQVEIRYVKLPRCRKSRVVFQPRGEGFHAGGMKVVSLDLEHVRSSARFFWALRQGLMRLMN